MEGEPKPDIAFFYGLDYENKTCLDCQGAFPRWISVNNAIIICQSCAQRHRQLGFNVSFVREMNDEWDPYLLSFVHRGGNGRFIRFSNDYGLQELSIERKYKTKAAEYYRKLILSEVLADLPPEEIKMDSALQECGNTVYFPEFDNYSIFKGERNEENGGGVVNVISQSIKSVGNGIESMTQKIGESNMKDTVIEGGSKAFTAMKDISGVVYDYSKPVVSFLAKKAVQGAGFLLNQLSYGVSEYQNMQYQKNCIEKAQAQAQLDRFNQKETPDCHANQLYPNQQQFFCNKHSINQQTNEAAPKSSTLEGMQSNSVLQSQKSKCKDKQSTLQPSKISQIDEIVLKGDKVDR